jgi:hypothetical protein
MRPKERRDTGQADLLRSRLDAIIDMGHPLVKLAATIDWSFLEQRFGAVYEDKPGRPGEPRHQPRRPNWREQPPRETLTGMQWRSGG